MKPIALAILFAMPTAIGLWWVCNFVAFIYDGSSATQDWHKFNAAVAEAARW